MAKLNYVEGDYKEALNIYARVGLDDLPLTAVPPYRLRMLAEAYATKGEARALALGPFPRVALCRGRGAPGSLQADPCAPGWGWAPLSSRKAAGRPSCCVA